MTQGDIGFGIVGLGRMGAGLAFQALEKGIRVAGFDVHGASNALIKAGLASVSRLEDLRQALTPPRTVFLYVPAGPVVDEVIRSLSTHLEPNDVIVDGGNSYWGDSIRRHRALADDGIHFIDLGTSGGLSGARNGACFMAGGEPEVVARIEPILKSLAVPGGYVYAGPPGAGHFTKLVHNGIEFGMLQAIGEGIQLLERYKDRLDVAEVLRCWRNGSVIRSWLVDLMEEGYRENGGLAEVPPYVDDTGEVNWLIADALEMDVPVPVISQAVMQLVASRDGDNAASRAIAVMRHGFGGHRYGKNAGAAEERARGRVGDFHRG